VNDSLYPTEQSGAAIAFPCQPLMYDLGIEENGVLIFVAETHDDYRVGRRFEMEQVEEAVSLDWLASSPGEIYLFL
jgi:hypothetical protein